MFKQATVDDNPAGIRSIKLVIYNRRNIENKKDTKEETDTTYRMVKKGCVLYFG